MIWVGDDLLILRPPKTGTTTVTKAVACWGDKRVIFASGIANARHAPLAHLGKINNFPKKPLQDVEVVMLGRQPENRALSLCKFALLHKPALIQQFFARPSMCILSGLFFDYAEMAHYISRWELYAGTLMRYLDAEEQPKKIHLLRLEDQLDDLADLIEARLDRRPDFGHFNIGRRPLQEDCLNPEARAKLLQEWGAADWDRWGYARP